MSTISHSIKDFWTNWIWLVVLPYKDQKSSDVLSNKTGIVLRPIYTSRKLDDVLRLTEPKPSLINQQCVVYRFLCPLCDAEYIGYTERHLFQRIEEHHRTSSSICKHLNGEHDIDSRSVNFNKSFTVLKKCKGKIDCLIYEMLLIKKNKPKLNIQSDSKVFYWMTDCRQWTIDVVIFSSNLM